MYTCAQRTAGAGKIVSAHPELNQGPIGLQPIALPLSYRLVNSADICHYEHVIKQALHISAPNQEEDHTRMNR
jgi:hypothetical protein